MPAFGCDDLPYYVVIPFVSVNALCVLFNLIQIAFVFTHFFSQKCATDGKDGFNKKLGFVSTMATIFLLITSILLFCLVILFQLCPSNRTNGPYWMVALATPIFILASYVSISASFFYRVVLAFKNSIADIKNKHNKLHKFISILITVESILLIVFAAAQVTWSQASVKTQKIVFYVCYITQMVVMWVHIILVIFLIKYFVKQLKYMFAFFANGDKNVNHHTNDGISIVARKLINTATKAYASYVFIIISTATGILFAAIFIPLSTFKTNKGNNNVIYTIAICSFYTVMNIDSVINTLCLSLQWPFSSRLYVFFCKKFHLFMMSKFSNEFKNASIDIVIGRPET